MNGRGQRANCPNRSDVEDAACALAYHLFVNRLGDREQTAYVRVDDLIPGLVRRGRKVVTTIDRRVVDQNVYAAPFLDQLARQMLHAEAIGDRHFERTRAPAERLD